MQVRAAAAHAARRGARLPLAAERLGVALALTALEPAAWSSARSAIPAVGEHYPSLLTPANVADATSRAPVVARYFATSFADVLRWNLLWPAFAAAVLWVLVRRRRALLAHASLAGVLFVVGGVCAVFRRAARDALAAGADRADRDPRSALAALAPFAALALASLVWEEPSRA